MKTYSEVLRYLYSRLPMYQRVGSAAYKEGLDNIITLCSALDNPQNKIKSIHIAGTNGKGSVSHYLASILQSQGYKNVGLHTSPHLKDFRERIKINGAPVSEQKVVDFVNKHQDLIERINPSFFEISVAMTFDFFAEAKSEIAIIETGLGGRLDSTNILTPLLSVITNISFDHTALLGNTIEKIAYEKAGIIKPKISVVIGETQSETKQVFLNKAKECNSPIFFADEKYKAENSKIAAENGKPYLIADIYKEGKLHYSALHSELCGLYQLKNIPTALMAIDVLTDLGYAISTANIKQGIAEVITRTGLLGRWQTLATTPLTIADTGHNEAGIKEILAQLATITYKQLHFVFGMVNDKEHDKVLNLLPKNATYYFCKADIPRALDEKELQKLAAGYNLNGSAFPTVKEALKAAQTKAQKDDLILVGGSTFIVADAL
jgi:dihydrofolate synthase/folylpolyglutamate synthase